MKWNILVIEGKKIKKNSVSTGEGIWKINKLNLFKAYKIKFNIRIIYNVLPKRV